MIRYNDELIIYNDDERDSLNIAILEAIRYMVDNLRETTHLGL